MKKALFFMVLMSSTLLLSANDKKLERANDNVFFEYVNGEIVEWHTAALFL